MRFLWLAWEMGDFQVMNCNQVDMSMENLEEVVRERNRAYYELEVGGSGEQEREIVMGPFGLDQGYVQVERATRSSGTMDVCA